MVMDICPKCNGCGWDNPAQAIDRCSVCNGSGVVSYIPLYDPEYTASITAEARKLLLSSEYREPCEYCGPGKLTGLPGNACENCMNTGLKYPTPEDLK